jgi:hypothetical protein
LRLLASRAAKLVGPGGKRPGSTPLPHFKNENTLTVTHITLKYRRPTYAAD